MYRTSIILYLVACASTLQILDDSRHQIYYQLTTEPDFSVIQFTIITSSNGYFGIGFGSNTMMNADIVICNYSEGTCQCQDYWSQNEQAPTLDTSQDVTTITALCSQSNNSRQYVFRRKLNTLDKSQDQVIQLGNQTNFIWVEGIQDNLEYHDAIHGNFQATLILPIAIENQIITNYGSNFFLHPLVELKPNLSQQWLTDTDMGSFEGQILFNPQHLSTLTQLALSYSPLGFLPSLQKARQLVMNSTNYSTMDSLLIIDSQFSLGWKFNNDSSIEFHVFWKSKSWVGLGFGSSMTNTDMVIAQIQGNVLTIYDGYSTGYSTPPPDAQQDLTLLYYSIIGTEVDFVFKRMLNTGDSKDQVLVLGGNYQFCYAYTQSNCIFLSQTYIQEIEKHSDTQYTVFSVPLSIGVSGQAVLAQDTSIFMYIHGILFFIAWGVVADIGIFFIRFQKTLNQYVNIHAYCFLFVDLVTIIMVVVSLMIFGTDGVDGLFLVHQVLALIMLSLVIIQHVVGVVVKHVLQEKTKLNKDFIFMVRDGHRILGTTLYILGKINILIGLYYFNQIVLFAIFAIWMISIFVIMMLFEKNKYNNRFINSSVDVKKLPVQKDHQILINLLNGGYSRGEIMLKLPLMNWVVFNKHVYDVTGMNHPGGNYILELVNGREIGRFIFAAYGLETTKLGPYPHSQKAYQLLQTKYIGNIDSSSIIITSEGDSINSYKSKELSEDKISSNFWIKVSQKSLSKSVMQVEFEHKIYTIKNFQKGVEWFGKHFTISTQEYGLILYILLFLGAKTRLYTTVISMSEQNIKRRNRLLELYDLSQGKKLISELEPINEEYKEVCNTLPFIIKKYAFQGTLSAFIQDSQHEKFVINGPFGLGLELKSESEGQHLAFVGGTGILPFLDLLDFLLQKAILMVLKQASNLIVHDKDHPQTNEVDSLNNNLELTFSKEFSFKIFASFINLEEFIGHDWITRLYQICKTHNLVLFDIAVRYSDKFVDPILPNIQKRFDQDFVISNVDRKKIKKVYVCGPPALNFIIPNALKYMEFQDYKIVIV